MEADREHIFKELLLNRLEVLLKGAGLEIGDLNAERESMSRTVKIAVEASNQDFRVTLHERDRRLIEKVRHALSLLDTGEFGLCVECGGEIGHRRLLARPVATHCIDCKTEHEQTDLRRRIF